MAEETIFSKIIRREIPSDMVYQDELVTAFRDISPQAPTHILIVPNVLIPTVNDVTIEHELALGRMMTVAAKIARDEGLADDGYRLIVNCNRHGGRSLPYPYASAGRSSAGSDAGAQRLTSCSGPFWARVWRRGCWPDVVHIRRSWFLTSRRW